MAKSFYKQGFSGRQVVLFVLVGAVVVVAAVKLVFSFFPGDQSGQNDDTKQVAAGDSSSENKPHETGQQLSGQITLTNEAKQEKESRPPAATKAPKPVSEPVVDVKPVKESLPSMADKLLNEALALIKAQDYMAARDKLSRAVNLGLKDEQDKLARKALNDIAETWLFSRKMFPQDPYCDRYKVVSGDNLSVIGKKFKVPYQLLMRINGIKNAQNLRAGETIKVVKGPLHAVVDKSEFQLTLYLGDAIVRTYPISIGAVGRDTPTGLWVVTPGKKQVNPAWTDPDTHKHYYPNDPDNPLGERWIGLDGLEGDAVGRTGFGIHGTIRPDEIGKRASRGCIRLLNEDVEVVYEMLTEGLSHVKVVE